MKRTLRTLVGLALASSFFAQSAAAANENQSEHKNQGATETESAPPVAREGLRFRSGLFGIAHARDTTHRDSGSMGVAPGVTLGPSYAMRSWEFSFDLRGALRLGTMGTDSGVADPTSQAPGAIMESSPSPTTVFFAGGPRARWFALEGSLAPFFSGGIDALLFFTESLAGVGASFHLGTGLEVMHDDAHGRLSLELGIDLPTFRMRRGVEAKVDTWGASDKHVYIVPVTLAANWTF